VKKIEVKTAVVCALMFFVAWAAVALKPAENVIKTAAVENLETLIPAQFAEWSIDPNMVPLNLSPELEATLKKAYSETLSRTYINSKKQRIMLSVAYGDGIEKQLDVHRPEICYPAQGFEVSKHVDQVMNSAFGDIPLRRLVAWQGSRIEPISYWITIGDKAVSSSFERKMLKLRYGLTGQLGSGLLVRVSSIEQDKGQAYLNHDEFIRDLIDSIPQEKRKRLIGERLPS